MIERTLSIIKPDATAKNLIGAICGRLEDHGLRIVVMRMMALSVKQAEAFYTIHKERPFFRQLVTFMTSGRVVVQVLEGEDAIRRYREIMGNTDPTKAAKGTIRGDFCASVEANAVHGSDSPKTAAAEIAFFFSQQDVFLCYRVGGKTVPPCRGAVCLAVVGWLLKGYKLLNSRWCVESVERGLVTCE